MFLKHPEITNSSGGAMRLTVIPIVLALLAALVTANASP
jgi:hypothetical protein